MRNTHTADAASTAASMHPARGMPIGLLISIGVIASMLVVAATILLLGWNSARSALMDTAQRTAHDTGQLINARAPRVAGADPIHTAANFIRPHRRCQHPDRATPATVCIVGGTIHQPDDLGDLCGL